MDFANFNLPDTIIGLLGFLFTGAGFFLWRTQKAFLSYIEQRNHNLEKTTERFSVDLQAQRDDFHTMLKEQREEHRLLLAQQGEKQRQALVSTAEVSQQTIKDIAAEVREKM